MPNLNQLLVIVFNPSSPPKNRKVLSMLEIPVMSLGLNALNSVDIGFPTLLDWRCDVALVILTK